MRALRVLLAALKLQGLGYNNTKAAIWARTPILRLQQVKRTVLRMSRVFDRACAGTPGVGGSLVPTVEKYV